MPPTNDFLTPHGAIKYESGVAKTASVATLTALKALADGGPARVHGNEVLVDADGSKWVFHSSSSLTGDDLFVATPAAGSGRWLRATGAVRLSLPITYATADAAVLATLPTGSQLKIHDLYWEISADFTGGSSSAIGVSSAKSGFSTKGDLLGGASGDVAATITAALSPAAGTAGAKMDTLAEVRAAIFKAADTIRFDRITSAFTAGAGNVVVVGRLEKNPGA